MACKLVGNFTVTRLCLVLIVAVTLVLTGCDAPDSQNERSAKKRGVEKAAKHERADIKPDAYVSTKKEAKPYARESQPSLANKESSSSPAPEKVLASRYRRINAGHYEAAYDHFDDQSQQLISLEQYKRYFSSVAPYQITSYSFPSVQVQSDTASVVADLAVSSSAGDDAYQVTQQMVRENGSWRVVMRDEQVASFTSTQSVSTSASAPSSASAAHERPSGDYDATVTVSWVVDGDTIEISRRIGGINEVRLIGVDTPETKDPNEGIEPYGPEASAFATEELMGKTVGLEFDVESLSLSNG